MSGAPSTGEKSEGAELVVGLVLLVISGFFAYSSWIMERPEGWGTAPGLLPLFLSVSLFVMAGMICIASLNNGGLKVLMGRFRGSQSNEAPRGFAKPNVRAFIAIAAIGVFYFVLLKFLPFEIAAILFFLFMTHVFWEGASLRNRLLVSFLMPILIAVVFQGGFGIPLPGEGNLVEIIVYNLRH